MLFQTGLIFVFCIHFHFFVFIPSGEILLLAPTVDSDLEKNVWNIDFLKE